MDEMGKAMMGTGEATGDDRAIQAAEKAIANPLLDEISLNGAKGVLINITGGHDLTLFELDEAANIIREKVDPEANIIVGSTLDTSMEGRLRVSVVATGIDATAASRAETPVARRSMASPLTLNPAPAEQPRAYAPQPAPQPIVAAAPVEQPVMSAPEMSSDADSDLFDAMNAGRDDVHANDGLPPPAYRPQPAAVTPAAMPAVRTGPASIEADPSEFVAPRPRAAGQPSPEALARLHAAVSRAPATRSAATTTMAPAAARPMAASAAAAGQKARFGIGSLINRMAGHLETATDRPAQQTARQQPPVTSYDDEAELGADQERIEIPAFLRRQAN
jgi:cell division protein FtsZ